jgi:hypothetical protein
MTRVMAKGSDVNQEPSISPQEVIDLFKAALEKPGWIDDRVPDQLTRPVEHTSSGMHPPEVDGGANRTDPGRGKKRGFSKSWGGDLEQLSVKRRRGAELAPSSDNTGS